VFRFIEAEKPNFPIKVMCEVLEVSKAGFYAWRKRPVSHRAQRDALILEKIHLIHHESRETYGAPWIHFELRDEHAISCGRKRVARLMSSHGIRGCCRRRRHWTTRKDPDATAAVDLLERDFAADAPDKRWVADIERHEALWNRAVMKGHRLRSLAGVR
jgi:putative transposase